MTDTLAGSHHDRPEHEMLNPTKDSTLLSPKESRKDVRDHQTKQAIHYRVVVIMAGSLFVGVAFALIHHFFYRYWNGRVVHGDAQQRWITRGGTAFAFGLKASLAYGTSVAYIQYFWLSLSSKPYRVSNINAMFTVLSSVTEFWNMKVWFGVPFLALLALITWCLPIAAIVSPGTLIVVPTISNRTAMLGVPQFDYRNYANYAAAFPEDVPDFNSVSDDLLQVALGSAVTESVLPINPPAANSTYTIDFHAPALLCETAAANDSIAVQDSYYNYSGSAGGAGVTYFAWVPPAPSYVTPYNGSMANRPNFSTSVFDTLDNDAERYYDGYSGASGWSAKLNVFVPNTLYLNSSVLNCSLNNASYTGKFDFRATTQVLHVEKKGIVGGVGTFGDFRLFATELNDPALGEEVAAYLSVMDAFGHIMAGSVSTYHYGTSKPVATLVQSTGLKSLLHSADNATLTSAIEKLFENVTMSLLSSSLFTVDFSNKTNAALFPKTSVRILYPQNIYQYQPQDLWLAYGIAIVSSLVCFLVGLYAIKQNGLSYNNDFTTIMRATRNPNLDLLVPESESSGANPVSRWTLDGVLTYRRSNYYGWSGFSMRGMQ